MQEKKNPKGFCCQIRLQHLNPKILCSFCSCISLGLWNQRKQIFWMKWMSLCTRDETKNVEKHLKNAHTILEATGKSTTIENYCQSRNCINKSMRSSIFDFLNNLFYFGVRVAHVYKNLWFCLIYFCWCKRYHLVPVPKVLPTMHVKSINSLKMTSDAGKNEELIPQARQGQLQSLLACNTALWKRLNETPPILVLPCKRLQKQKHNQQQLLNP